MHIIIHTPVEEWDELVEATVKDWVGLIGKTGETCTRGIRNTGKVGQEL